jgi:hypothetical protein
MRRLVLATGVSFLAAALVFWIIGAAAAQEGEGIPTAHQAFPQYTGPETCAMCHLAAFREVVNSLHYQHQGAVPYREGWDEQVLGGMYVTY